MRKFALILLALALAACGKSEIPPVQPATSQTPPAAAPAATVEPASVPPDAVATPTSDVQPVTPPSPAPQPAVETPAADAVLSPALEPPTPAAPAPVETAPPATSSTSAETALPPTASAADAPYQVVDGRIDQNTVEGWKIFRGIGTCATCHGPVGQGGVGPALVESLKQSITKELFVETVTNGRSGTMMKPFGENPVVMENLDKIYAYLKARADGVLGPENLIKYPLGKIE